MGQAATKLSNYLPNFEKVLPREIKTERPAPPSGYYTFVNEIIEEYEAEHGPISEERFTRALEELDAALEL